MTTSESAGLIVDSGGSAACDNGRDWGLSLFSRAGKADPHLWRLCTSGLSFPSLSPVLMEAVFRLKNSAERIRRQSTNVSEPSQRARTFHTACPRTSFSGAERAAFPQS